MVQFSIVIYSQCQIEVSNDSVAELLEHFQSFFGTELREGEIIRQAKTTSITFQASKSKIQILEEVINLVKGFGASLN